MKYLFVLSSAFFFILSGFFLLNRNEDLRISQSEQLVNQILSNTAKLIKKKYKIQPSGTGVAMPGGPIREWTLCFDTKGRYKKANIRKLLIECAQELLQQINMSEEIRPFLIKSPFTIENVEIIIFNHDKNGYGLNDPEISTARISQGILIYRTIDPCDSFKFKNQFKESYEEALKALQSSNPEVRGAV